VAVSQLEFDASASTCQPSCSSYAWTLVGCTNAPNAGPFPKDLGTSLSSFRLAGVTGADINIAGGVNPITCKVALTVSAPAEGGGEAGAALFVQGPATGPSRSGPLSTPKAAWGAVWLAAARRAPAS
jgi:hypothetical protein